MKRISLLIRTFSLVLIISTSLTAQDSLFTNFNFSPFEDYSPYVKAGGDLNGDGYDDLIITDAHRNTANIYFGGADFDTIPDLTFSRDDFEFWKIAYNGDLNGDGFDDLVISYANHGGEIWGGGYGRILVFLGSTDFDLDYDYEILGTDCNHGYPIYEFYFGTNIDISADYNGDGYNDLTTNTLGPPGTQYGLVHVFNGGAEFDTIDDNFFVGEEWESWLGASLSIGDINGDGFDDLALAYRVAPINGYQRGIKIFAGGSNGLGNTVVSSFTLENATGVVISSDFNGDGCNDIFFFEESEELIVGYGNGTYEFDNYQILQLDENISYYIDGVDFDQDGFDDLIFRKDGRITEVIRGSTEGLNQTSIYNRSNASIYYFCGKQ